MYAFMNGANKMKIGLYPGSFDPITHGHVDIAKRALKIFDKLVILVSVNPEKQTIFTKDERIDMIKHVLKPYEDRIEVTFSDKLTVHAAKALHASHIIRGLRAVTDFEYEFQMTHANRELDKGIDSIFFMTDNKYSFLSSTAVKEIAQLNGDLTAFVPPYVKDKLQNKYHK